MNRREFIRNAGMAAAALALPQDMFAVSSGYESLIILHTNDIHSHLDPFPDNDPRYPGQGGMARIAQLVKDIRSSNAHVLLLDSGDVFQGTPYFNFWKGEVEYKVMNQMGYTASTLGNHDFDNGSEGLAAMIRKAEFSHVNCNYNVTGTPLEGLIRPSVVWQSGKLKVGILGVGIDLEGLVDARLCRGVKYTDPVEAANREARRLKGEEGCQAVILLSHLGYEYKENRIDDKKLAAASRNIDVILGGHTHTFLDAPVQVKNADNKEVVINQAGWAALRLGQVNQKVRV